MIPPYEMLLRLAIAAVLGGLVGLERERAESAAGLRTHALVALGAALFMLVSMFGFTNAGKPPAVVLDPSRVAAQIVTGIGFLGAGVIIFRKEIIRGLTTAASVWLVAAIGMAVGGGLYAPAIWGALLALAILAVMKPLESRLFSQRRQHVTSLTIDRRVISLEELRSLLASNKSICLVRLDVRHQGEPAKTRVDIVTRAGTPESLAHLAAELADQPGVLSIRSTIKP
ncbi:MAG TPA: MgtC/SapB family protein [Candidatus Acidoferrales bacterium]|nr:MgtC/SapB family protein [Candidatus Acidoferrales bacterium]HTX57597.1 MgtC/SapB family protein [Candidatus Acidoferrales bacterium]